MQHSRVAADQLLEQPKESICWVSTSAAEQQRKSADYQYRGAAYQVFGTKEWGSAGADISGSISVDVKSAADQFLEQRSG